MKWRFEFPIPTKIISYSMVSADDPAFNPLDITLEGTENDGTTSTVSTRTVEFDYVGARKNYSVTSTKLFTYADLNVLSTYGGTNVTRLADIEIYGTSIAPEGSTILPSVQSVAASKGGLTTSEDIDKLSDFNKANMYRAVYVEPIAITYTYATPQVIDTYAITASKSNATRDPKSWILEASNNGTTWTVLDEQTAQAFSNRYATQFYRIANKAEYTQYRLTILENGGEAQLQIGELQFLQMNASTSIQSPSSALEAPTLYVSSGILSVNTNVQGHLSVYDLQGRLLQTQTVTAGTSQVSIQHLPTGTYVASLQINGKRRLLKFFK